MVKSKIILFSVLAIIIIGGIGYIYYFYEVDFGSQFSKGSKNISVSAHNEYDNKLIAIDYEIYVNNTFYSEGKTSNLGSTLEKIPINNTYQFLTFDKNNNYYNYLSPKFVSSGSGISRIDLYPRRVGELYVTHFGDLGVNTNLTVIMQGTGLINEPITCLKWSFNVLDVRLANEVIDNPKNYENYDRCYEIPTLDNSKTVLNMNYSLYGDLDSTDFIELIIIDRQQDFKNLLSYEGSSDIGLNDQRYVITA